MSRWTIWPGALLAVLGAAPAAALPVTVPPAPARQAPEPVTSPDPDTADLTVVGGLWSLRPGATGTVFVNVANGGPATALRPVLTMVLPRELSAVDTSGCRQATSSITDQGVTTIACRWKQLKPVSNRVVPLKVRAAQLTASEAELARPKVTLSVSSDTPDLMEEDNSSSFRVRIQPLAPAPAKAAER